MQKNRVIFGVTFGIFFIGMILVLVGVLVAKDGTKIDPEVPEEPVWWKTDIIYQIYPRSFKDSDGDGIGDLNGIVEKVDYLKELGIGCVWLSPIYPSPMKDFGYDISDYRDIDPIFGTMEDFKKLVKKLHRNGIKLVMDFVPNHTSDEHIWFRNAVAGNDLYYDYYVWEDPREDSQGDLLPPNNWESVFTGSAWNCTVRTDECYYHAFLSAQPDLNYRSDKVREQMQNVLRFWLDYDVDGFRMDAVMYLEEDRNLTNNPVIIMDNGTEYIQSLYTIHQPETFTVLSEWREVIDQYNDKLMMVEVYDDNVVDVMKYYGSNFDPIAHFPFNFLLITQLQDRPSLKGELMFKVITDWLDNVPEGKWPNWVLGNHDRPRLGSRFGEDIIDAFNMISLLLPGTPVTYYGEEIGMTDTWISFNDTQDPQGIVHGPEHYIEYSRDPERTPMQWDDSPLAGFSTADEAWIPVNENYTEVNVAQQKSDEESHLKVYKELAKLRKGDVFIKGNIIYPHTNNDLFSFIRYTDEEAYMVLINLSENYLNENLHHHANFPLPDVATVVLKSTNNEEITTGEDIFLSSVPLPAGGGVILQFKETTEEDLMVFNYHVNY